MSVEIPDYPDKFKAVEEWSALDGSALRQGQIGACYAMAPLIALHRDPELMVALANARLHFTADTISITFGKPPQTEVYTYQLNALRERDVYWRRHGFDGHWLDLALLSAVARERNIEQGLPVDTTIRFQPEDHSIR